MNDDGTETDILHDFYIPILERSVFYDRVAGYFTSTSLASASKGFSRFVENNGKARFIVGVDLDQEDAETILKVKSGNLEDVLLKELVDLETWPDSVRHGIKLMAWMLTHDHLDIKVAVRVHKKTGEPKPMSFHGDGYMHEKWAIFGDGEDKILISGSLNESRTALTINAENIDLSKTWDVDPVWAKKKFDKKHKSFEAMWSHQHPSIRTYELPKAIRERIIKFAGDVDSFFEIDGTPAELPQESPPQNNINESSPEPSLLEKIRFALIRLAPLLPNGQYVGMETAPVAPWPHQRFVATRLIDSYPKNHLLCDEVGLGKTIEAGLAFRSLWLSGLTRSIRVFAPASLTSQWMNEMAEKFYMSFCRRTSRSGSWERKDLQKGETLPGSGKLFQEPLEIISTGLLINQTRGQILQQMPETDMVLVDEAHKARRQNPDNQDREPRPNKLYRELQTALYQKSRALYLATATPMQLNRVEAFDLLKMMPSAGNVQFSEDLCGLFYQIRDRLVDGESLQEHEKNWFRRYLANVRVSAPEHWAFVMNHVLGPINAGNLLDFIESGIEPFGMNGWDDYLTAVNMLAPLGRSMLRHTRALLREYQKDGLLKENLAQRHVEPKVIQLKPSERVVYDKLQDYCAGLAEHIAANMNESTQQAAIGFYLSFLRLRFASSFEALKLSLERRLIKIARTLEHKLASSESASGTRDELEELDEAELEGLVLKNRQEGDLVWEQGAVNTLLAELDNLPSTPSKTFQLLEELQARAKPGHGRVRQVVVFTRYTDTLNYLYRTLMLKLPNCPIGTFSGEGGTLRKPGQSSPESLDRTMIKQQFVQGQIDILLCTDAAAEGLNLQSADLLINFDLPWNPMLLEQRIGRIDRIGQHHQQIYVSNYLYQGSVEEVVYVRLVQRFHEAISVTGALQFSLLPIHQEDFEDLAKSDFEDGKITEKELLIRAEQHARKIKERQSLTEYPAKDQRSAYEELFREHSQKTLPVTLDDIWEVLITSEYLQTIGCKKEAFSEGEALALFGIPGVDDGTLLTISRSLIEHGLRANELRDLRFATYGDPVFDKLLDHMTTGLADVNDAWVNRKPIAVVGNDEIAFNSVREALDHLEQLSGDVRIRPRAGVTMTPESDNVGVQQQRELIAGAARLAQLKLRPANDTPNNQISEIDRFRIDVIRRSLPAVNLEFSVNNQSALLATEKHLLWPMKQQGESLSVQGDVLFIDASRSIIYRALNSIKKGERTRERVVQKLTEGN
ncbi:helicase-related protein [Marinobacter sp. DY40_1A1]|uniref:helicase-related protein n=1 Tax=Marinobacter sp. DY40_1A1 TaxID=2583229 RepID=UPI001907DAC6|nr:helicase-related protein [Marinobacter sp. DY40_1A1]MBK1887791.1 hypothetical protein [Marinobacter sp. DY40_1A1]